MSQRHLDRLTPVDASFLHQESGVSHMHIGGLTIIEGPPPSMEEFLEQIRRRLHLVPRYRHKLAHTAIDSGRPVWIDDPSFNLDYHVRHTALPAPGRWEQLQDLTARIFSQQLDRTKPLWEMWLIEGLEDDRFALITKTHHSLIDGIAGVDLATVLFDLSPDPPSRPYAGRAWQPHPEPGTAQLLAAGLLGAARAGLA
jgi:diacylglycerol O-acyltransferase